jgi:1-acyl-sn-glycerol-3-phosphate acyltransferase
MLFLRSLLYFLGSTLVLSFLVALALSLFFLPVKYRYGILSKWSLFSMWWLKITLNIKFNVIGKENIPSEASVIVSNHQSTWETMALQTIFPHQTWVLKQELQWIPIFGWGLILLKPIIIDRGEKLKAIKKVIKQGSSRIKEGIFVVVFPEGTRQPYQQLGDYQSGGMAIAKKTGCDIVPVYHNAGKLWPKGNFIKRPGTITVVIGTAMKPTGKNASTLTKEVHEWTLSMQKKYQ